VSNIVKEVRSTTNSLTYQIGTRNAATTLRLRDGETQVLAGLISDEDRRSAIRVPGLGELPIVGRLFSSTSDTNNRTEIVLLITPRLQRTLARPEASSVEFAAGTEAATGLPRLGGAPVSIAGPEPAAFPPSPPGFSPALPSAPVSDEGVPPAVTVPQPPGGPVLVPFGGIKPAPQ
jgi:general secretion pathway protein D